MGITRSEKILLVEDEQLIASDLRRRLEGLGFGTVDHAASPGEALEAVRRSRPDLVLMDGILGSRSDGRDAAQTISEQTRIPIVFLSGYAEETRLDQSTAPGPVAYVVKPFTDHELSSAIELALNESRVDTSLNQQERWLDAILDGVADGIIAADMNNRIQFMNHAAEELTGWSEEEARGLPVTRVVRSELDEPLRVLEMLPRSDDPFEESVAIASTPLRKRNGQIVRIEGSVSRIHDRNGSVEGQVLALRDVTAVSRMTETINYQASHDTLTGLCNREHFSKRLDALIDDARGSRRNHAFLYLDIDQFKVINDTCGHVAGDELLRHTTSVIRAVVRASDLGARLGSDEFGILLEATSPKRAHYIAERLRARLNREKFLWNGTAYTIAASIGVVEIGEHSKDIYRVLAAADDACIVAKELGGNRIQVYEDEESVFRKRRGEMRWISRVKTALEQERFVLFGQPIVPILDTGKRTKCELLLRMKEQDGSIVTPMDFLPAAERYNLMPDIDRWVVTTAFEAYASILEGGNEERKGYTYCINLSGASMIDQDLLTFIRTEFVRTGVPPEAFCFEITETAAIGNITSASRLIGELKQLGCTFSLDDFGSGFSSFSYLKNLPVDYLKIDGSFVKDMHLDPVNRAMVNAINNLGKLMKMETVAEFVSNGEILEHLRTIGVDYAQGYEVGRPTPLSEM